MFKQILKSINTLEMPTFFEHHHIITVQCTVCTLYIIHVWDFDNPKKSGVLVLLFLRCIVHLFVSQ